MAANDVLNFNVATQDAGLRLDAVVAAHLDHGSRSYAAQLIRQGHIQVDGIPRKPSYHVKLNEVVTGRLPQSVPVDIEAEPIPLNILFEDTHLIVIDKPAGMVVHPAAGHPGGTLVNALLYHCPDLEGIGGEQRPGIVHRLDKDTSGVMVVAKQSQAHHALSAQFKARTIRKQYQALVYGNPVKSSGEVDLPIGRHPVDRKKMATNSARPRVARTLWQVRTNYSGVALLNLDLKTGRTHQIRVHCLAMGHPIVGDPVYRQRRTLARLAKTNPHLYKAVKTIDRQMLHAFELKLKHPVTEEYLTFQAPLPDDMKMLLQQLGQG